MPVSLSADAKTKVVVATDSDTAPFTYKDGDKFAGYDIDVVEAIFSGAEDYEIKFETVPFSLILTGIDAGRYQIGANDFNYNEERAENTFSLIRFLNLITQLQLLMARPTLA